MVMDELKKMLKRHEGYSSTVYKCSAGANTIGWGHNIDATPLPQSIQTYLDETGSITIRMAEQLLDADIKIAKDSCKVLFHNFSGYSENRQNALIDFLFNVGITTAGKFKNAIVAIKESEDAWCRAALEFKNSKWFSQVGSRGAEICKMIQEG